MSNTHATLTSLFTDIADAIRAKTGGTSTLVADNFPAEIGDIVTPNLQTKTVTSSTSTQTVMPDSEYNGLSKVTVNAIGTATQATPSISVSSAGLITASATQTAGYVAAGTKSATKQLTVQAAKTITPSTSSQTAVASGRYTTGAVTVAGDADLIAANIKEGINIFGVTGTCETYDSTATIYAGTSTPSNSIGSNGDIYFMKEALNVSKSIKLTPSFHDTNLSAYASADSSYPASNVIGADENSTTYARFYMTTGMTAITKLYYGFDVSSIPSNATITGILCQAKARM